MKKYKKVVIFILTIYSALFLTACKSDEPDEYTSLQSFEYHFYPEEYEEEYSEFQTSFTLEADKDYKFQVDAACESGTIKISINYENGNEKIYEVSPTDSCNDTISIPANTVDNVYFVISIDSETKGQVIGEILTR